MNAPPTMSASEVASELMKRIVPSLQRLVESLRGLLARLPLFVAAALAAVLVWTIAAVERRTLGRMGMRP